MKMLFILLSLTAFQTQAREARFTGEANFWVETNTLGLSVEGKSQALNVDKAQLEEKDGQLFLSKIEAVVPSKTLDTDLGVRNEHMQKEVFAKADPGKEELPALTLKIDKMDCKTESAGHYKCTGDSVFSMGTKSQPTTVKIDMVKGADGFTGQAEFELALEKMDLPAPTKFKAKVLDPIKAKANFKEVR